MCKVQIYLVIMVLFIIKKKKKKKNPYLPNLFFPIILPKTHIFYLA